MNKINNLIISASAGSGKTYRLTTRFLFLLLNGQDPTKTVALTFSKATAGEFLLSILRRLAGAAGHPALCKELADDFERDFDVSNSKLVTQENCALSLDRLVKQLHRLNLWTIDGFFNRVLSVFPFEFGLTGGYTIIDEPDQEGIRHQVLVRMLHGGSSKKMERLASSFKSANTGKASGRFFPDFSDFVKYNHPILLEVDNDSCWGDPMAVWGVSCPHQPMAEDERLHQLAVLREEAPGIGDKRIEKSLFVLAKKLEDWIPGQAFASVKCVEAAWRNLRDFKSGNGFCTYGEKSCAASADLAMAIGFLLHDVLARDLRVRLDRTRGRLELLRTYEDLYRTEVRDHGLLTFADFPVLLQPGREGAPVLTQHPNEDERLWMDYRMDAQFDHWFFDEFQDTSNLQWNAMRNLAEEAAQGNADGRSLFAVGDPKQAIYAWRGGDHSLFEKLETTLGLKPEPMNKSWRSVPAVLKMVNKVFGGIGELEGFNADATRTWSEIWDKHRACKRNKGLPGCSRLYFVEKLPENKTFGDADYQETVFPLVVDILRRTDPVRKGLECGILVSWNKHIPMVVDHLLSEGIQVAGDAAIPEALDNPATSLLYSLFMWVVHPEDGFSGQHLRMSPLKDHIPEDREECDKLRLDFLQCLAGSGFESAILPWVSRLGIPAGTDGDFSRMRIDGFLDLCRVFDETGNRDIDKFLQFVEGHRSPRSAAGGSVKVMTIHRAKGVSLDMTIVLGLDGKSIDQVRANHLHVGRDAARRPKWVMELPPENLCQADPVLREAYAHARTASSYENLCKLYVALTRAKYGLYVISPTPTRSANYPMLFSQSLDINIEDHPLLGTQPESWQSRCRVVWESEFRKDTDSVKDCPWHDHPEILDKKRSPEAGLDGNVHPGLKPLDASSKPVNPFPSLTVIEPSRMKGKVAARPTFRTGTGTNARRFGTDVHAVLEQIEWIEADMTLEEVCSFNQSLFKPLGDDVFQHVRECLQKEDVRALFTAPGNASEVWREKHFLTILHEDGGNGRLCSGVMDRVVLHYDSSGTPVSAEIIDFKTDRVDEENLLDSAEQYRPQLETYKGVLSKLTGLPPESIATKLLFTLPGRVVSL